MFRRRASIGRWLVEHPRLLAAGAGSLLAAAGAAVARRRPAVPVLPLPDAVASVTALAVHNAAKGAVIAAVREADAPEGYLVSEAVRSALREAVLSGVDLAPAAIGAVQGAQEVAHLVGESRLAVGQRAATAAAEGAAEVSDVAVERIRTVLAPYLTQGAQNLTQGAQT